MAAEALAAFLGAIFALLGAIVFFHYQRKREEKERTATRAVARERILTALAGELFQDAAYLSLFPRILRDAESKASSEPPRKDFYVPSALVNEAYKAAMGAADPSLAPELMECLELHRAYSAIPVFQQGEREASEHTVRGKEGGEIAYRVLKAMEAAAATTEKLCWDALAWLKLKHGIVPPGMKLPEVRTTDIKPEGAEERAGR